MKFWRLDPGGSLSDWTLVITHYGDDKQDGDDEQGYDDELEEYDEPGDETEDGNDDNNESTTKKETASAETFHVHRTSLSFGPRRCKYFSTLFFTQANVSEKQDKISRITLDRQEADAIPVMLDFVYRGTLDATTQNAVPLRNLGRYFQCPALVQEFDKFIDNDLSEYTAVY